MENDELNEMIDFLFKNKVPAHIEKFDGFYSNGLIKKVTENLLIIDDRVMGATPILISSIKIIEKFRGR